MTRLIRLSEVLTRNGQSRSAFYNGISRGIEPRAIKIGPRAAAWYEDEVNAVVQARIAGLSDNELRALVKRLHAKRAELKKLALGA